MKEFSSVWEDLRIPQDDLESVSGERDLWNSLLTLLTSQTNPRKAQDNLCIPQGHTGASENFVLQY